MATGHEKRIVMLGLDGAGKTSLLRIMKSEKGSTEGLTRTLGYTVEKIIHKCISFIVWDLGGSPFIRGLWEHYLQDLHILIFVVDTSDHARIEESRRELYKLLKLSQTRDSLILIFGNKMDQKGALSEEKLRAVLKLDKVMKGRRHHVQLCSCVSKQGVSEGLDWIVSETQNPVPNISSRPCSVTSTKSRVPTPPSRASRAASSRPAQASSTRVPFPRIKSWNNLTYVDAPAGALSSCTTKRQRRKDIRAVAEIEKKSSSDSEASNHSRTNRLGPVLTAQQIIQKIQDDLSHEFPTCSSANKRPSKSK